MGGEPKPLDSRARAPDPTRGGAQGMRTEFAGIVPVVPRLKCAGERVVAPLDPWKAHAVQNGASSPVAAPPVR